MASTSLESLDQLPVTLLYSIMEKLDIPAIRSLGATCKTLSFCASRTRSFVPYFHLLGNPYPRRLKLDCSQLNDSATELLLRPSLHKLYLYNCEDFSTKLLSEIGRRCKELRSLYLGSVAALRDHRDHRAVHISDLEELLYHCDHLEALVLMFDASLFPSDHFAWVWGWASKKLTSLEIGYISSVTVIKLLSSNIGLQSSSDIQPSILPGIQKLALSVDYITDAMVGAISEGLTSLTHLDLHDAPLIEPRVNMDLTNTGLEQINCHGKLKHLSLIRRWKYRMTYFKQVDDRGIHLMADKCANMESICLGGFCSVTDEGFRKLFCSCSKLYRLKVSNGSQLTNLDFDAATSLSLTHVSLRYCHLLTNLAIKNLVSSVDLEALDLAGCKNLGDEALQAISSFRRLKILKLNDSDVTDAGVAYLKHGIIGSLVSLSLRGCNRLTDKCIFALFDGSCKLVLQQLDLSNIPDLSDSGVRALAESQVLISELRLRQCLHIGDSSIEALALMQVDDDRGHGSSLRLLDLYNCGGITQLALMWLKTPYFPRLRQLGVTGSVDRSVVDALAMNRPFLHVACRGEELGTDQWDEWD